MKKFNVTYEQIASYSNIYAAYLDARKGKSERNEIMRFSLELDAHLNDLYNDLQEERYKVGTELFIFMYQRNGLLWRYNLGIVFYNGRFIGYSIRYMRKPI